MSGRPALVPALAGVALLLTAGLAAAHTGSPVSVMTPLATASAPPASTEAIVATRAAPSFPWPLLLLVALAPAFARRRSLKLAGAALVLVLAVFAFETAFHSVHHGFDREAEAACPTASAAFHAVGTGAAFLGFDAPLPRVGPVLVAPHVVVRHLAWRSPHPGRAPPSTLA